MNQDYRRMKQANAFLAWFHTGLYSLSVTWDLLLWLSLGPKFVLSPRFSEVSDRAIGMAITSILFTLVVLWCLSRPEHKGVLALFHAYHVRCIVYLFAVFPIARLAMHVTWGAAGIGRAPTERDVFLLITMLLIKIWSWQDLTLRAWRTPMFQVQTTGASPTTVNNELH